MYSRLCTRHGLSGSPDSTTSYRCMKKNRSGVEALSGNGPSRPTNARVYGPPPGRFPLARRCAVDGRTHKRLARMGSLNASTASAGLLPGKGDERRQSADGRPLWGIDLRSQLAGIPPAEELVAGDTEL